MAIEVNNISPLYQTGAIQDRYVGPWAQNPRQTGEPGGVRDRVSISDKARQKRAGTPGEQELSAEEKQQVNELKKLDAEVKAHEQAHMSAGGGLVTGGASYQYEVGPDGKRYAVGGEVSIDVSPERTPEATIRKMQQVKRAALAPAQPSGTDRAVAARATQSEAKARADKTQQDQDKAEGREEQDPLVADPAQVSSSREPAPQPGEPSEREAADVTQRSPAINRSRRINLFG